MKKAICMFLSLILLLGLCSCSFNKGYKIECISDMPPFYFQSKDGSYEGIDIGIMDAIGNDLELKYELKNTDKKTAITKLTAQNCDTIFGCFAKDSELENEYDFSEPYYTEGIALCVSAETEGIDSLESLKGKKVAVYSYSNCHTYASELAKEYNFSLTVYNDYSGMYSDIITEGAADAFFEELTIAEYAMNTGVPINIVYSEENLFEYVFVFAKGQNEQLKQQINQAILNIKENGKYEEIISKYK